MKQLFIDVREPSEFATGHVSGALNIPPAKLLDGAHQLDGIAKDTELVVYCLSGSRSTVAIQMLRQLGFTNLTNGINMQHVTAKYLS